MGSETWKEGLAGAASGAVTVLLLYPLEVVRTRLQVQEASQVLYKGTWDCVRTVAANEGLRGLYAGLTPSLIGNAVSWGLYWASWRTLNDWNCSRLRVDELTWDQKILCGIQAGVFVSLVTNPIWVVKTHMQLAHREVFASQAALKAAGRPHGRAAAAAAAGAAIGGRSRGVLGFADTVRSVARQQGLRGFYRGIGPALLLCSHGALQMMAYEELKSWRRAGLRQAGRGDQLPRMDSLATGAAAKLFASVWTYPLQVARARMQQPMHGSLWSAYSSLPRAFVSIVKTAGVAGLYQGFIANALKVCPQAGLQFFFYEQARHMLGR